MARSFFVVMVVVALLLSNTIAAQSLATSTIPTLHKKASHHSLAVSSSAKTPMASPSTKVSHSSGSPASVPSSISPSAKTPTASPSIRVSPSSRSPASVPSSISSFTKTPAASPSIEVSPSSGSPTIVPSPIFSSTTPSEAPAPDQNAAILNRFTVTTSAAIVVFSAALLM